MGVKFDRFLGAVTLLLAVVVSGHPVKADDVCDVITADTALEEVKRSAEFGIGNADSPKEVIIYGVSSPSEFYLNEKGLMEGSSVSKIESFMNKAELNYKIQIAPWSRAYTTALTRDNIVIALLNRTKEREDKFHWLLPLYERKNNLVVLSSSRFKNMTISEILDSEGKAVCIKLSSQCDLLSDMGFKNENIIHLNFIKPKDVHQVLLNGSADFYIYDMDKLKAEMEEDGLNPDQMTVIAYINTMTAYLATSVKTDPVILNKLLKAVESNIKEASIPILQVLTYENGNLSYKASDDTVHGSAVDDVREYLDARNIKYRIWLYPWKRAFEQASHSDNSIILFLVKNEARSDKFHWLLKLHELSSQLITRNDPKMTNLTKEEILQGNYIALCDQHSVQCTYLTEYGFPEKRIMKTSGLSHAEEGRMILRNRMDFAFSPIASSNKYLVGTDMSSNEFSVTFDRGAITSYLAASKNLDPRLLERLLSQK